MIKLLKKFKKHKPNRKNYRIKPRICFEFDDTYYVFALIPTIVTQPWMYRLPGVSIIDITWLNFHVGIGEWERKKEDIDD